MSFKIIIFFMLFQIITYANNTYSHVSVQFNWKHQFEFAGFYAAIEKGFYEDAGIKVTLKELQNSTNIVEDVSSEQSTFGIYNPSIVQEAITRKDIILLANYFKKSPLVLVSQQNLYSVSDLQGKKVMLTESEIKNNYFEKMFQYNNIDYSKIQIVPHTFRIDEFENGAVDAMSVNVSHQLYLLQQKKVPFNILDPNHYGTSLMYLNLFTSKKFAKKNPALVKKFLEATNKGWRYALENKKEIVDIIYSKYNTQNKSKENLLFEANKTAQLIQAQKYKIGSIDLKQLDNMITLFSKDSDIRPKDILFHSNIPFYQQLSRSEKKWLNDHPKISIGIAPDWLPFETMDQKGNYVGMVSEYFKLLEKKLNIQFNYKSDTTWDKILNQAKTNQVDMMSCLIKNKQREEFLEFTQPYLDVPVMIFSHLNRSFLDSLNDLKGKKIGKIKGYAIHKFLSQKNLNLHIVEFENIDTALDALSDEKINYFVNDLPQTRYYIQQKGIKNIQVVYDLQSSFQMAIGISKHLENYDLATRIFQKALDSITIQEKINIKNKWINTNIKSTFDYILFWKIFGAFLAVVLFILYWNKKLRKEIDTRIETEKKLVLAQKTAKELHKKALLANEAKSDFLANMSHEIRTPMNAVIGMTTLAQKKKNIEEVQPYLNKILLSSNLLLDIINEILDFSKIEAGKIELEKTQFNIYDLIYNNYLMFENVAKEKGIEFIINHDHNVPTSLLGDPTRLKQILSNFLSNAFKFTDKGSITITIKLIDNSDENFNKIESYHNIYIGVEDTGLGIQEKNQHKLFDAFSQEDETTTRKHGGTGLGLTISKKFVELMGGTIDFKSTPNIGSTFYAIIPFKDATHMSKVDSSIGSSLIKINDAKILTLDDNKNDSIILTEMLKKYNFNITHTTDEKDALKYINQNNYDLLILDWMLPKTSGIDFYKNILDDNSINPKPEVIIVSAYDRYDILENAKGIKEPFVLEKPFSATELLSSIIQTLSIDSKKQENLSLQIDTLSINFNNQTILVAEDNELNQEVIQEILKEYGIDVIIANNGQEAYDIFMERHDEIKLILMDLQMPILDGYESSKKIRCEVVGEDVPIIALTADAISGTKDKVLASGMNDYATKPINQDQLIKTLCNYLEFSSKQKLPNNNKPTQSEFSIYGIDVDKEIQKIGGNEEAYFTILKKFSKNYKDFVKEAIILHQEMKFDKLKSNLHQLKGVVGNIGAYNLFELTKEAEILLKEHNNCDEQLLKIESELTKTINSIKENLPEDTVDKSDQSKQPFNKDESLKYIDQMIQLLEDGNSEVEDVLEKLKQQKLPSSAEKLFDEVYLSIEDFEYNKALVEVKKLKEEIENG